MSSKMSAASFPMDFCFRLVFRLDSLGSDKGGVHIIAFPSVRYLLHKTSVAARLERKKAFLH